MIRVEDLRIAFDGKTVIDGISFSVPAGGSLVLMGKNGAGKSVILKALAGLIEYEGRIEIGGVDIRKLYQERFRYGADEASVRVAYVFQRGGLFDSMNVFENVGFGLRRMGVDEEKVQQIVTSALARVGLRGNEMKMVPELSGGMQKRVGLARAICMQPNLILFDDPTAGLDPILADSIADLIVEIRNTLSTTSVIATHEERVARKVADSVALLYAGKIVYMADCATFFSAENEYARQFIEGDIEGPIDIF